MDGLGILAMGLAWLLIVGAVFALVPGSGGRSQIGAWLALTVVTMFVESIVAFVTLRVLLFRSGAGMAAIGLVVAVGVLQVTPVAWALILRRRFRRSPARSSIQS